MKYDVANVVTLLALVAASQCMFRLNRYEITSQQACLAPMPPETDCTEATLARCRHRQQA